MQKVFKCNEFGKDICRCCRFVVVLCGYFCLFGCLIFVVAVVVVCLFTCCSCFIFLFI